MRARVVIVCAGWKELLTTASVVGGLVGVPVIAVPTSVGYGAAFQGLAALLGMINSCASNVSVVNIDNGFGAGYVAALINRHIGETGISRRPPAARRLPRSRAEPFPELAQPLARCGLEAPHLRIVRGRDTRAESAALEWRSHSPGCPCPDWLLPLRQAWPEVRLERRCEPPAPRGHF